jgi:ABC-type transport system involved in multi-copper enzyme maturation permease subunit
MIHKEINSIKLRALIMLFFMLGLLILVVSMQDYVTSMSTSFENMKNSPGTKWAEKFLGESLEKILKKMQTNDFYIWSQWYGKNFGQFLPLVVLIIAFPIFAKETEKKTIYFLLARKKRNEIFTVKALTGLFATIIIILLMSLLPIVFMNAFGKTIKITPILKYTVQETVVGIFFYTAYMFFSVYFNDTVKVIIAGIAFFIGDFMLGLIEKISFLNVFPYISCLHVYKTGSVDWVYTIWLLLISAGIYLATMRYFQKKDF